MLGEKVIAWARKFLDESIPLSGASWSNVQKIALALALTTVDGKAVKLKKLEQFVGYLGEANTPTRSSRFAPARLCWCAMSAI